MKASCSDAHGELGVLGVDHDGDLDLGGGDHLDVDPLLREHLEHARGDAGVRPHADADDGDLGDVEVAQHVAGADLVALISSSSSSALS